MPKHAVDGIAQGSGIAYPSQVARVGRNPTMHILLIRLCAIGDVTRVLSAAQAIRNAHPGATIDFAVSSMASEVVEEHEAIDNLLVWRRPKTLILTPFAFLQYLRRIKKQGYNAALDFSGIDWRSGLVIAASRARLRIGYPRWRCRELSYLFTNLKVELRSPYMNRVDEFAALIQPIAPGATAIRPKVAVGHQHNLDAEAFWQEHMDVSRPTVLIHPPVNDVRKRWPLPRFAELADRLLLENGVNVLLTWGPGQEDQVKTVLSHMKTTPVLGPGFDSIKALTAFIARADLFVGNDTGPMHIANAVGTPVVALFRDSYILSHRPYWQPQRALYHPLHKHRRLEKNRGEAGGGLDQIDVETVHKACVEMLADCATNSSES